MRYKALLTLLLGIFAGTASANWEKVNDLDYTWGPFKIYNIALFTETGQYELGIRPLMLTLEYAKPVDGRDFAISIARAWANLGINLPQQEETIERLRKTIPDLKPNDKLSYIALPDTGYFVLNDTIIPEQFDKDFNNAMVAVWLDPKIDLSAKLTTKKTDPKEQQVHNSTDYVPSQTATESSAEGSTPTSAEQSQPQAVGSEQKMAVENPPQTAEPAENQSVENVPPANEATAQPPQVTPSAPPEKSEKPKEPAPKAKPSELESPEKQIDPIGDPAPEQKSPIS
ncbi:hypothetical protein B0187_09945 [Haemophilus paracuniculus]|uniref:Pyruvate formate lyase-activating protein n=1 Tax=Haemophilus paracuniculus TaxID=734 RepID=A0A1T0AMV1_9PAST|nr:hypothetical protein [Haemophilus paracuniculus]OOR97185.1 hypothetical protein B0187_09945 [Haemophilus paracuniculus]